MNTKESLQNQIKELEEKKKPLEKELRKLYQQEEEEVNNKIKRCEALQDKFSLDELIYSAHSRCECGAGMAYPKGVGIRGSWVCGDILLGRALPASNPDSKVHSGSLPFAFYEIKSEQQPSANGATTRPAE